MNHHIVEDTAGYLNIGYRRRLRITGGHFNQIDLANLALLYHIVYSAMVVVKATAETNLQLDTCILCRVDCFMYLIQIIVNRLLTEDMLLCFCSLDDEV